jgi:hypothetical protein
MSNIISPLAVWLLPLSICWAAMAIADGDDGDRGPADRFPACEIVADQSGNSIILEGLVFGRADVSGSYHMQVWQKGLGSSRISQSGDFKIPAGAPASLGIVSLARGSGSYSATLTVRWNDGAADCVAQAPNRRKVKLLDEKSVLPSTSDPARRAYSPCSTTARRPRSRDAQVEQEKTEWSEPSS